MGFKDGCERMCEKFVLRKGFTPSLKPISYTEDVK